MNGWTENQKQSITASSINLNESVKYDPKQIPNGTKIFQYDLEEDEDFQKKLPPLEGMLICSKSVVVIFANIIGLVSLIAIALGLGIGLPLSTPKTYNSTCTKQSDCIQYTNYGLTCSNGLCVCMNNAYYYEYSCYKKKDYLTKCGGSYQCDIMNGLECKLINNTYICSCYSDRAWNGTYCNYMGTLNSSCSTIPCDTTKGLNCSITNICECPLNYFWNGTNCDLKRSINDTCIGNYSCDSTKSLYCAFEGFNTGICTCDNYLYWNPLVLNCVSQFLINASCVSSSVCRADLGLICNSLKGICVCNTTSFWSSSNNQCVTSSSFNESCSSLIPCDSNVLLTCSSGICECITNYYWDPSSSQCVFQKSIGGACSSNNECLLSINLTCNTFCSCPNTMFWNYTQCVPKFTNGDACIDDIQCQGYNNLTCQNGTCECPSGAGWFWAVASESCVQCPSNWTIYYNHCYYVNKNKLSWFNALTWCQNNSATLMKIRNNNEYQLLYSFYNTYSPGGRLYIGARSIQLFDFRWTDNSTLAKNSSWWCNGEPNNSPYGKTNLVAPVKEDTVFMWTAGGKICLNDYPGTSTEPFACEKER